MPDKCVNDRMKYRSPNLLNFYIFDTSEEFAEKQVIIFFQVKIILALKYSTIFA